MYVNLKYSQNSMLPRSMIFQSRTMVPEGRKVSVSKIRGEQSGEAPIDQIARIMSRWPPRPSRKT